MHTKQEKLKFLTKAFGSGVLGADGINYAVKCPGSECKASRKKKLIVRLDNDMHHCWVCGLKGRNLAYTLRRYRQEFYDEYIDRFLGKAPFGISAVQNEEDQPLEIPDGFIFLATSLDSRDPDVRDVLDYARSRGLGPRELWRFKLGTCKKGRFRRRLIMPSFNYCGDLNYFIARAIDNRSVAKYLNAKVPKKSIIFNEINIDWTEELTLVEGPMDMVKCNDNSTCLLGSHLNENYLLFFEIVRHSTPVAIAMDSDAQGKAQNIAKKLFEYNVKVRVVDHGKFSDVGEMSRSDFAAARAQARSWTPYDRLHHMINSINSGSTL